MAFFEDGDRLNFYRLFDRCIPEQYRLTDLDAQKVEFWLQIYFAIFPALPAAGGKKGALPEQGAKKLPRGQEEGVDLSPGMARLRAFIETRGADAARTGLTLENMCVYYNLRHGTGSLVALRSLLFSPDCPQSSHVEGCMWVRCCRNETSS